MSAGGGGLSPAIIRPMGGWVFVSFLRSKAEASYALLRIMSGLMFSFHGVQKIFGAWAKFQPEFGTQLWFGGVIELVCGIAIAAGAFTSFAALLASGTMAVAYTQFHWKLSGGAQLLPKLNQGELALLYAFLFLYIACRGSGIASVDQRRKVHAA